MAKVRKYSAFSISDALEFGWTKFRDNFAFFLVLELITILLSFSQYFLKALIQSTDFSMPVMLSVATFVAQMLLSMVTLSATIHLYNKNKVSVGDMFKAAYMLPSFIGTVLLKSLIVVGGLVLLIIPAIIWGVRFQYASYCVIDRKMRPLQALKQSSKITKGYRIKLFFFDIFMILINILGFLCFFIGLAVTVPVTMLAMAYVYKRLAEK